jgi:hypothetical protein
MGVDERPVRTFVVDEGVAAGLRVMGVSEADIAAAAADERPAPLVDFEVYADCWDSVMLFDSLGTQWVWVAVVGLGSTPAVRSGLNYAAVESAMRMKGIRRALWPDLLADLQVMEHAVLEAEKELLTSRR